MAQYEHLPIYQKAIQLSVYVENVDQGFNRYHKYNNGTELRTLARNNIKLIISANSETASGINNET